MLCCAHISCSLKEGWTQALKQSPLPCRSIKYACSARFSEAQSAQAASLDIKELYQPQYVLSRWLYPSMMEVGKATVLIGL